MDLVTWDDTGPGYPKLDKRARKQGVRLGRAKKRPSELIRKLYLSRLPYKEISRVCNCSEGAVGVEARLLKSELGIEKVKAMRSKSKRREVLLYKPEVKFNSNDVKPPEREPFVPVGEVSV